ncbi:unnamed protein product, partial [Rotaria sp. Silwood1]
KTVSNLKCFSLISFRETIEYDNKIVPLLRRISFIDGNHLVNDILSNMSHLHTFIFNIINKFPGGLFVNVRHFVARSIWRPFEHDFFAQISQAFPLLNKLTIFNTRAQKKKLTHQGEYEQISSVIEFPHLTALNLCGSSLDYVEQFLFDFYTRYMLIMNFCCLQHSILQLMLLVRIVQK